MTSRLIIASAVNYKPQDIRVLLRSAARHIPDSSFLLFHERTDTAFRDLLQQDHPSIHLVRPADLGRRDAVWKGARRRRRLRRMPAARARLLRLGLMSPWRSRAIASLHVVMARYFWALDAMHHPAVRRAQQILLCDSRDVCVQADPFEAVRGDLVVGAWDVAFKERTFAMKWLRERFPQRIADRVAPQLNLSNGLILGTREMIGKFLEAFTREIIRLNPHPFGQTGDQRLINVLLHGRGELPFTLTRTGESLMAHLIQAPWDRLTIDRGELKTARGETVCLLHHYEFHPELVASIREKFEGEAGRRPEFHPVRPPDQKRRRRREPS